MTPPVLRSLGSGYQWPKALDDIDVAPDSVPGRALRAALDRAGIDDDTPEISRNDLAQSRYRMMDMHRYYTNDKGEPRDRHLHAELDEQHNAAKHVFKTRDGKTPTVKTHHDRKKGKISYTDLPPAPGSSSGLESGFGGLGGLGGSGNGGGGPCTCPLCVDSAPQTQTQPQSGCQCPICLPALLNGLGGGNARLLTNAGGEGDVDPRAPDSPRTLQDLMDLLSVHRAGKKIIEVAGDLTILKTEVCMLPIELGETGPGIRVFCADGLPDQKTILQDPLLNEDWAVGPRTANRQHLLLKITKTVHIHVHFVLKLVV